MSERRLRLLGAACGIAGPIALAVYFAAPATMGFPTAAVPDAELMTYATGNAWLFYLGAWVQATGALLSVLFFLILVCLAGAQDRLSGLATIVAASLLLAVVLVEAAFLIAVPEAAAGGNTAMMRTAFNLSNGAFVRVYPLAPASATFLALGFVLLGSAVLHRWFAYVAIAIGVGFEVAGFAAIFSGIGLLLALLLSLSEEIWIPAAAIALALSARRAAAVA